MRKYMVIYLLFILLSSKVFAEDIKVPITALIENIKEAKVEDRRNLMNQLKIRLREMNQENRKKTMMELRKTFNAKRGSRVGYKQNRHNREHRRQPIYRQIRQNHGRGHR